MDNTENTHYVEKKKEYASKGVAGTGLGLGIAGTALALLNGNGLNLFGNGTSKSTMTTQDYVDITKEYYKQRLSDMKELAQNFYAQDQKITNNYIATRDSFDILSSRIAELEKKEAVTEATAPLLQQITQMQIAGSTSGWQNAVAIEAERRNCADGKLVNYMNSTFVPQKIVGFTTSSETWNEKTYNPLGCNCNL